MISAYFDDSGTHDKSEIVVVAGVFGTEARLRGLDRHGRKSWLVRYKGGNHLLSVLTTECHNSTGEYAGWSRAETDFHCYLLRQHIVDADVSGYGVACSRKDWDELVTGDLRDILGTPEGFCIRNCLPGTLYWSEKNYFDPVLHFVFDTRPSAVRRDALPSTMRTAKSPIAKSWTESFLRTHSMPCCCRRLTCSLGSFISMQKRCSLRRTHPDLTCWISGAAKAIKFDGQIAPRESIEEMWDKVWKYKDPDMLKQVAKHFRSSIPRTQITLISRLATQCSWPRDVPLRERCLQALGSPLFECTGVVWPA